MTHEATGRAPAIAQDPRAAGGSGDEIFDRVEGVHRAAGHPRDLLMRARMDVPEDHRVPHAPVSTLP
jgi:hypothetical protein